METIRLPLVKEGNAESKEQIAWTDEAEPGTECPQGHGRSQTLHDRVAQLLRDSIHEAENAGMGWVAASKNPNVHQEAMKEAENQIPQPDKTGCARMLRADGGVQRTRILVYGENQIRNESHNKWKAHTHWVLWTFPDVWVYSNCLYWTRRVPNGTSGVSHPMLLR